ncbi:MAG TPA: hypothetical protein VHK01_06085 [Lacipirellulaceae bacterium]|nr:hypothetical protein [Lacipirellulaceae bacterium]
MPSIQTIFWIVLAVLFLVGLPIMLVWSMVDYFRGKGSERRGGGSFTAGVGAAMQELDRVMARPSVEHIIKAENPVLRREDDSGAD